MERFARDGFSGIELWENHILKAEDQKKEMELIKKAKIPVAIYNTYTGFSDEEAEKRKKAAEIINYFGSDGVKYNLGKNDDLLDVYLENLQNWADSLPEKCRLLCECHGGTVLEDPETAGQVLGELDDKFQAIVHCCGDSEKLVKWFDNLGEKITHAHVSLKANGKGVRLSSNPGLILENLYIMKTAGFKGTFTLEFTEGLRSEKENIEDSYQAALDDLQFLQEKYQEVWN